MDSIEEVKKLQDFENRIQKLEAKLYDRILKDLDSRLKVLETKYQD